MKKVIKNTLATLLGKSQACNNDFPLRKELPTIIGGPKPNKWTEAIELFDDGQNICIWGYQRDSKHRVLASRWVSGGKVDDWYIEPDYVVADYLVSLENRLNRMLQTSLISKEAYSEFIANITIARDEFNQREMQKLIHGIKTTPTLSKRINREFKPC